MTTVRLGVTGDEPGPDLGGQRALSRVIDGTLVYEALGDLDGSRPPHVAGS